MTKIIALDAGHGLKTAGKQTPDGIKEWTLNDLVRDYVVAILKDYDVQIIHTDGDEGMTDDALTKRRAAYVNVKADAFVSIHHNAYTSTWNSATGVEIYVDNNYTYDDMKLANCIYERLHKYTGLRGRGVKKENWAVINQNQIPAVLVEGGFMDSRIDHPVITSSKGQEAYAKAVAEGLIEFLSLTKKADVVEPYSGYVKVIVDDLNLRNRPSWEDDAVCGIAAKGGIYEIVGRIKVNTTYMYKLRSGAYITSAIKYVEYLKELPKELGKGSKVKILKGATYGGLASARGKSVPASYIGKTYTVGKIQTNKNVKEALITELNSWVALKYLEVV